MKNEKNKSITLSDNEISMCSDFINVAIITIGNGAELRVALIIMLSQYADPVDYDGACLFCKHGVDAGNFENKILMMSHYEFDMLLIDLKGSLSKLPCFG